jgi:hypothetical protein
MIFIKKYFIIIALFFAPTFIFSQSISLMQYKGELGMGVGTAAFVGQVGAGSQTYKSNFNFFYKKFLSENFSVRINYEYIPLAANDLNSKQKQIALRGFNFYRTFHEVNFLLEYFFSDIRYLNAENHIIPYVGLGFGYLLNVPTDKNNFITYTSDLQKYTDQFWPICTMPINLGLNYRLKNNINLFSECSFRLTTSDLIDHFSATDPIITANGTFNASKKGNDKFYSLKLGISKSLFNFYGNDKSKKKKKNK